MGVITRYELEKLMRRNSRARNCTCDKFRRNRFWRYKVKS